jgi:TonB-linked SusC/RagA family outer membrane protein
MFVYLHRLYNKIKLKEREFMKRKLMLLLTFLVISVGLVTAQTRKVSGVVISSEDGQPVIGASVLVVGTDLGSITDYDGNFVIPNVPSTAKFLRVSYVGMRTQKVAIKKYMKITMKPDAKALEGVVVVGYGSKKKIGSIVSSVSVVDSEKLENRPVANVADALQGQVAGLQIFADGGEPSATVSMRLRGVGSINAGTEPLFILDGSPVSSGVFNSLNPNDVASMTVLKDASATAVYGSRAANGVVIITTKRGKLGEKPKVNFSASYGISKMTGNKMEMMNASQFLNFQEVIDPTKVNDPAFQETKKFTLDNGIGTDWAEVFFGDTAPTYQVNMSVRGGSDKSNYYVSFGHYEAEGIMDDSSYRRETIRSNMETKISDWLKVGANIGLSYKDWGTTAFGGSSNSVYNKVYASRVYRPDQSYYEVLKNADGTFKGYGDRLDYFDKMGYYNPYYLSEIQPSSKNQTRLNASTFVNINPIEGLNIRAAQALEAFDYRYSYKALPIGPFKGAGSAREQFQRMYRWTLTNTAEYKFNVEKHNFIALVGQESILYKNQNFRTTAKGLTDKRLMLMSAASSADVPTHSIEKKVFNSYFSTLSYNYDEKYYTDLSIRADGSSLFGENNQWAVFYSVGAMWDMKKEAFLQEVDFINNLQLRASYGTTGNSSIASYRALGLAKASGLYDGKSGTAIANPANPDLTWETIRTTNIGVSGRMFDFLTFELEYYNRMTEDMLMEIPYSMTTGYASGWGNVANMRNRGFDAKFTFDIIKNHDMSWTVTANVNYNKNEITELFEGRNEFVLGTTGMKLQVGKPYGEFFYTRWAGVDPRDGYDMWYDKNGNLTKQYSDSDKVFTGKQRFAPWSGGINTSFQWKGISVSADFSYFLDNYIMNNTRYFVENPSFASKNNQTTNMLTMWQKPGDITEVARPESVRHFDTHLLENASFLRMKTLTVGYTFPKDLIRRTGFINNAKVYFVGRNLLTFTGYSDYDPEMDTNISLGNYPNTKEYSVGLELTF